jgi:hypothetical protein
MRGPDERPGLRCVSLRQTRAEESRLLDIAPRIVAARELMGVAPSPSPARRSHRHPNTILIPHSS